jgi:hypothetical protein
MMRLREEYSSVLPAPAFNYSPSIATFMGGYDFSRSEGDKPLQTVFSMEEGRDSPGVEGTILNGDFGSLEIQQSVDNAVAEA